MIALFGVNPLAPFVQRATDENWAVKEIDAGHDAMVTHPGEVAETLNSLA